MSSCFVVIHEVRRAGGLGMVGAGRITDALRLPRRPTFITSIHIDLNIKYQTSRR